MPTDRNKSEQDCPEFAWSPVKEQAALDLATDDLTHREIAEKAEIASSTLALWKLNADFAARVESHQADIRTAIRRHGIAVIENRVRALDRRWRKMLAVIEARGADVGLARVPGGNTGLLVHNVKGVGKGEDFQLIDLYEVDTGLLRELREHEKQAAQELGQWAEKAIIEDATKPLPSALEAAITAVYGPKRSAESGSDGP